MKNKAPLSLMEQLVMLLVFALSAALCLQIYVLSEQISHRCEAQAHAVTAVQNTAESVKFCRGNVSQYPHLLGGSGTSQQWEIGYDHNWTAVSTGQTAYRVVITPESTPLPTLGKAVITAMTEAEDILFSVTVSWQEVA